MKEADLQNSAKLLLSSLLQCKEVDELFSFLRDLLTEAEILEFSQRLDIARRLHQKESYKKIEAETGVSSTTIARVAKFLKGAYGGYRKILEN
jgi:TrpR-related protein YerC/YecD